jgi:hypothetical protein
VTVRRLIAMTGQQRGFWLTVLIFRTRALPRRWAARSGVLQNLICVAARAGWSDVPQPEPKRFVYLPRENVTNPSRFGIFTFRSVCASIVSLSAMMPLRFRI